jgi:hypothetical protein
MLKGIRKIVNPIQAFRELEEGRLKRFAKHTYLALRELNPKYYISPYPQLWRNRSNRDAIFIHIPKTAGTSLISVLEQNGAMYLWEKPDIRRYCQNRGLTCFSHFSIPGLIEAGFITPQYFQKAWKFAFVRNPYDRALSLYLYSIGPVARTMPPSTTFSIFCSYLEEKTFEPIGLYVFNGLSQLNPQTVWLTGSDGTFLCDFVGKVENLENDFEHVRKTLSLKGPGNQLPRENTTLRRPIESYYSDREMKIVARVYAEDFERFGYDPFRLPQK